MLDFYPPGNSFVVYFGAPDIRKYPFLRHTYTSQKGIIVADNQTQIILGSRLLTCASETQLARIQR